MADGLATLARPRWDINHVLAYGQSLAMGYEGWPALSQVQQLDNLMLGDSVRGQFEQAVDWQPSGPAALRPLAATVQDIATGRLLSRAEVAALPHGATAMGETVLEGALHLWRARQLAAGAVPGAQQLLASACGVGGRSLEALSSGADPDLFNRLPGCARHGRAAAAAWGFSYGVAALLFLQGEHNAWGTEGCASGKAEYAALLRRFHADALAALAQVSGQAEPPGLFLYQTGGAYASETLSVAQAQLEFALSVPGCFMAGPSYPVSEKGGHLDANGYRWLGQQFGKVLHRVLDLGQAWRPLHPLGARQDGQTVQVAFHVPVPPLAWGRPMVGQRFDDPAQRGFTVHDAGGAVALAAVALDGPAHVRLTLARPLRGPATLRYASSATGGRGALRDSDAETAADSYAYDPATGHRPAANVPELAGRPYPLHNWCAAFAIPIAAAESAPLARLLAAVRRHR